MSYSKLSFYISKKFKNSFDPILKKLICFNKLIRLLSVTLSIIINEYKNY